MERTLSSSKKFLVLLSLYLIASILLLANIINFFRQMRLSRTLWFSLSFSYRNQNEHVLIWNNTTYDNINPGER